MKKIILSAAVLLASVAGYAQHSAGTFTIQPKIGMNIANISDADGTDPRIGLAVGAEAEYYATDMVSISAGAIYSMQGTKFGSKNNNATLKLDYINVPILANVYVMKGLAVKLGLQPGFKVSSKLSADTQLGSGSTEVNGYKSVDLSIPVGLSYEYANFVIDGRYNFGVTKIADGGDSYKSKNSVFQITLGYKFAL